MKELLYAISTLVAIARRPTFLFLDVLAVWSTGQFLFAILFVLSPDKITLNFFFSNELDNGPIGLIFGSQPGIHRRFLLAATGFGDAAAIAALAVGAKNHTLYPPLAVNYCIS